MLMTEVLDDVLGNKQRIAGLSGPNHAEEVSRGIPSATVVAAYEPGVGELFQDIFMTPFFRVYTNPDVVGVELCGASKNVVAIARGHVRRPRLRRQHQGDAHDARTCRDDAAWARALGANPLTYMGLAGHGRPHRHLHEPPLPQPRLGRARSPRAARCRSSTTRRTWSPRAPSPASPSTSSASAKGLELPITQQVRAILYEGKPVASGRGGPCSAGKRKDELHGLGLVDD